MTINSLNFIYFIIPLFILYYIKANKKWQNLIIFIGNLIFITISDIKMFWCVVLLTITIHILGLKIHNTKNIKKKKLFLSIGIIISLGMLIYFKYLNFFISSLKNILSFTNWNLYTLNILIPLGISFYVFRSISYLVDIYRNNIIPRNNICDVFIYTCFFPTYLSGPIDRAITFFTQLDNPRLFNYSTIVIGCRQILWGIFKKVVIADNLAITVNNIWSDLSIQSSSNLIIVSILYFFQLYMDFSGYSDMAIGVGKLLGIDITKNFKYPFFSRNIAEFWRRWHISLNNWFVQYLYIPLGGNRKGTIRTLINTIIIFTLCGFWHGSSINYALWGLFNGILFIPIILSGANKKYKNSIAGENKLYPGLKEISEIITTFILCTIGFIIFRAPNLSSLLHFFSSIINNWNIPSTSIWDNYANLCLLVIIIEWICRKQEFPLYNLNYTFSKLINPIIYIILVELILHYGALISSSFIYAKF